MMSRIVIVILLHHRNNPIDLVPSNLNISEKEMEYLRYSFMNLNQDACDKTRQGDIGTLIQ
jgi:hypothetical protein